jgi:hypothetical protein
MWDAIAGLDPAIDLLAKWRRNTPFKKGAHAHHQQ